MAKLIKEIMADNKKKKIEEMLIAEFGYSTYRSIEDKAFEKLCKKVTMNIVKLG